MEQDLSSPTAHQRHAEDTAVGAEQPLTCIRVCRGFPPLRAWQVPGARLFSSLNAGQDVRLGNGIVC